LTESGFIFGDRELKEAARIFDFPICVFNYRNRKAFFDKDFKAATKKGQLKGPMYAFEFGKFV
jgi:hypothetical protein